MEHVYKVSCVWPYGVNTEHVCRSTQELKTYLDEEVFCLKHKCPLPVTVTVEWINR